MTIKVTYNVTDVYVTQDVSPVYINVSYSSGGGSGAAVWGGITGTLSDQTDLQTALDLKVPYTGATANVDLGEYELKTGQVEFDQTPTGTAGVGVMRWNDSDGTLDLGLKGGNVTLQVGQEQVARVVNKSGVNLLESAYQVVKVTDAQGQRLAVDLAQGNNDANSTDTIGIVTENIDNNQEGFITTSGIVRNINTTGSLQGETWNDGDVLYLSPTTAGAITNIKPTAPNHTVILGYVVYAHAVNGKIFVKCDNGYELGELHDVYVPTPSNNDGIFWNSANLRYENKSVSGALGYTPANSATTLTINGVTYDLSTSRTWSVGSVTGSGANGQVAYWNGTSSQTGSTDLQWNGTNVVLGNDKGLVLQTAGTNRNISLRPAIILDNFAAATFYPSSGTNVGSAFSVSPRGTGFNSIIKSNITVYNTDIIADSTNYELAVFRAGGSNYSLSTGKAGTGTTRPLLLSAGFATDAVTNGNQLWLYTNGNIGINTSSDGGQRLQVQGTTLLNGNVTFSSSTGMFWDATNSRLGIGTNAPLYNLDVTGGVRIGSGVNGFIFNSNTISTFGNIFLSIQADRVFSITDSSYNNVYFRVVRNTGNTLLNSTTDTGERLQVTGTMKVTGASSFGGINTITYNDNSYQAGVKINNTNSGTGALSGIEMTVNSVIGGFIAYQSSNYINANQRSLMNFASVGNNRLGFFANSNQSGVAQDIIFSTFGGNTTYQMTIKGASSNILINTNTDVASAIFNIESTTKGFLPPRMTTTQKNAISSPAAGLVVYDTTLAKLCVYTTAWETITSI